MFYLLCYYVIPRTILPVKSSLLSGALSDRSHGLQKACNFGFYRRMCWLKKMLTSDKHYIVTLSNGGIMRVTGQHPICVAPDTFCRANALLVGHRVMVRTSEFDSLVDAVVTHFEAVSTALLSTTCRQHLITLFLLLMRLYTTRVAGVFQELFLLWSS
jgi:hypothetical protein